MESSGNGFDWPIEGDSTGKQIHRHIDMLFLQMGRGCSTPRQVCHRCCKVHLFCKCMNEHYRRLAIVML